MQAGSRAAAPAINRSLDVEMGPKGGANSSKRRRRRTNWRMPASVALGTFTTFIFFVYVGRHGNAAPTKSEKPKKLDTGQPTMFTYQVMKELPHDFKAFTQGIEYEEICPEGGAPCKEIFWESTGLNGRSSVREVEVDTGKVLRQKNLPSRDFGEGITKLKDRLYQVTWQSPKTWSYAADNFDDAKELETPLLDGWGITNNGSHLIVGDSSNILYFLDPETMEEVGHLPVTDAGQAVGWLNELEWVDGLIYANIWQKDCIAQIDPATGGVVGWVVMKGLKETMLKSVPKGEMGSGHEAPEVLNGIAWDSKGGKLYVTGKLWPRVYQVELRPMYMDSKATDVVKVTADVRKECIVSPGKGP